MVDYVNFNYVTRVLPVDYSNKDILNVNNFL